MKEQRFEGGEAEAPVAEPHPHDPPTEVVVTFRDDDGGRVRNYDELEGNEGRSVFFRPHRYAAADLEPLRATVLVEWDGGQVECPVRDVSQNGVAFRWPVPEGPRLQERLRAVLRFDEHQVFEGEILVGSVRGEDGATVVGVLFRDFLLDVDEILQLRQVAEWGAERVRGRLAARPWNGVGQERFKALVAELRLFLEDAKRELSAMEECLPWHVLNGPPNPARTALRARIERDYVSDMVQKSEEVDAALRLVPGGHGNPAALEWARRHVHEYLMEAPILHRALQKPFGYPGDYEVMNFMYTGQFEGPSLFARAVNLGFTTTRAALAVRCRKDLVKRQIARLLAERAGSDRPLRVLSIAAGPAQELQELLSENAVLPARLDVVLFEQDKNALAHAWRHLHVATEGRPPGEVKLTFLHDSIKRLLRDRHLFAEFGQFDFIYCCGLFDYLAERTSVILTRHLARSLAPGGRVVVANMVDHATRWIMEHHLDWMLLYRTREQLLDMGRRAVPGARASILEEASGANPFVELVVP